MIFIIIDPKCFVKSVSMSQTAISKIKDKIIYIKIVIGKIFYSYDTILNQNIADIHQTKESIVVKLSNITQKRISIFA